ncbi:MAG: WD40 repeat domain-containing protein [Fimbriimonadaceae bacterium]|nr:WD40 repeat domain-containing protein [Fimbriimonadaceae bacterium]QYK59099.1 MAG: WD40 repeat domain-containing protein [Fimbriimonadaceae bacterium]
MSALVALALVAAQDTLTGHTREVNCVAVSPDGKTVASGSVDDTARLWSDGGSKVLEGHDGDVTTLAFSPDGKLLATGEMYKKIRVYEVATGALKTTIEGLDGRVTGVAWSPSGATLYASNIDRTICAFEANGGAPTAKVTLSYQVVGVAVSKDGTVASLDDKGGVVLWSPKLERKAAFEHGNGARSLAFSPDGLRLVTSGGNGPLKLWDVSTGDAAAGFNGPALDGLGVAFSPDGTKIAVGTFDNLVVVVDAATGAIKAKHTKHERVVTGVAWSPDGKRLYSSSMDMTVRSWPG